MIADRSELLLAAGDQYYAETNPLFTVNPLPCPVVWGTDLFPAAIDGRADIYGDTCAAAITWQFTGPGTITIHQVEHFFEHYKDLESTKWVKVLGWGDADEAKQMILRGIEKAKQQQK